MCALLFGQTYSQKNFVLPEYATKDLNKLLFTYDLLDRISDSIFVGWDNYREAPIKFTYENGLSVLVSSQRYHDNYFLFDTLNNYQYVYVDTSNVSNLIMGDNFRLGAGISPVGKIGNERIWGLNLRPKRISKTEKLQISNSIEMELTSIIHELTHMLQIDLKMQFRAPHFQFDSNLDYATNSTLEGLALKKSFFANDRIECEKGIQDFINFRLMKRKEMDSISVVSESNIEFCEGTAEFARYKSIELIEKQPEFVSDLIRKFNLPENLFANFKELKNSIFARFENHINDSFENYPKVYTYGLMQALICEKLYETTSRWIVDQDYRYFDEIILSSTNNITKSDVNFALLKSGYNFETIKNFHLPKIEHRDSIVNLLNNQKGNTFQIDFKPIRKTVNSAIHPKVSRYKIKGDRYFVGFSEDLKIDEIEVNIKKEIFKTQGIWILEIIDQNSEKYDIDFSKKDNDIYYNFKIITSVFDLSAPKVKVINEKDKLKIELLSRL